MSSAVMRLALVTAVFWACVGLRPCPAATADDVVDKQKKQAGANLKQAEIANAVTVETDDLIVCATLPEDRAKTLAAGLQKCYLTARKPLGYEEKEQPWTGKLTYYFVTEPRQFKTFMRAVVGESPRDSEYHFALKGDAPYVLDLAEVSSPAAQPEMFGEAGALVAVAVLNAKTGSGVTLPDWARMGFGRAVSLRAEGPNSPRVTAYRSRAKSAVLGGSGKPPAKLSDVWDGTGRDGPVLATSLMDFLAFGPKAADFPKVVSALKPGDNNTPPALPMALETATGMKWMDLELAWKKWVQSGK
jgi:hypothetical protein